MGKEIKKNIAVDLEEYVELLNRNIELEKLEVNGVDNWEGYDIDPYEEGEEPVPFKVEDFRRHPDIIIE